MTVSLVTTASAQASSVTVPTHAAGDLLVIYAIQAGAVPSVPSGWTSAVSGVVAGNVGAVVGYRVASGTDNTSDPSGTWGSAAAVAIHVYRGAATAPGTCTSNTGTSNVVTYPAATLAHASGSWVARFAVNGGSTFSGTTLTGYTQRTLPNINSVTWDTNGAVSSNPTNDSQTLGGSGPWVALTVEIPNSGTTWTDSASESATATETAAAVKTTSDSASESASATETAAAVKGTSDSAPESATASETAAAVKTTSDGASTSAAAGLTAAAGRVVTDGASISVAAGLTADGAHSFTAPETASAGLTAAANVITSDGANIAVTADLTASPPAPPVPRPNYLDPAVALAALQSDNPLAASEAAHTIQINQSTPSTDIEVQFYTNFYKQAGGLCGDYKELKCTFIRNTVGTATITLKHTDPLVDVVMNCYQAVVPVTIKTGYLRWSGRVEYVDYEYKDGVYNVVVYCTSDYQWFDKILCWPNFLLPIQTQFPKRSLYIGPAITCIKTLIMEQCFRLQSGIWEIVNNLFSGDIDWESWFGTLLESNGDLLQMLMTPIVVVPTDPLFDASPWTSINGRMDKVSTLVEQVVKDNGLVLTADLWLPGEPQPEGLLIPLTAPTIVVDVKDMSGVTGPTGTFVDGLITDVVDLQHGVLGDTLSPFLNPGNQYAPEGVNIAPTFGVNFTKPWVLFQDHPRGGLREWHLIPHSPLAHTVIGGGKSPHWVNDLINATLEYLIDAIEIAVGFTGIPDTLLDGTFDDTILAFQQIENFDRRVKLGPYGFPEYFQQTGASAYTLDEWFALQSAMWDTRGYHGVIVTFDNGYPYVVGRDLFIGGLASFAARGNLYTDYIERIEIEDSPTVRAKVQVMIGDGKSHDDPTVKIQRKVVKAEEALQILTMSQ